MRNKPSCSLCGVGPTSTRTPAAPVSLPRQTSQRRESKKAARKVPLQPAHAPAYAYYSVAYIMMNTPDRVQKSYSCSQLIRYTTFIGVTKPRTCHPYSKSRMGGGAGGGRGGGNCPQSRTWGGANGMKCPPPTFLGTW